MYRANVAAQLYLEADEISADSLKPCQGALPAATFKGSSTAVTTIKMLLHL